MQSDSLVHVYSKPIHMALSFDGLKTLIGEHLQSDVRGGDWFLFFNRQRNYLKALWFDGTGFNIHAKKLEVGQFAALTSRSMTRSQFDALLQGAKVLKEIPQTKKNRKAA